MSEAALIARLEGMVVMHRYKGLGVVTHVDEEYVTVSMGMPVDTKPFSVDGLRYPESRIVKALPSAQDSMDWKMPLNSFLDKSDWSVAPNLTRMERVLEDIGSIKSNTIIPTSLPSDSIRVKEGMLAQSRTSMEDKRLTFDPEMNNGLHQLINTVDWQLSWFLLKGKEGWGTYRRRMELLEDSLDGDPWSTVLLPRSPRESKAYSVECAAAITHVLALNGTPLLDAVHRTVDQIERRIRLQREIIAGFNRNRQR